MASLVGDPPDYVMKIHEQLTTEMLSSVETAKKYKLEEVDERLALFVKVESIIRENQFLITDFYNGLEPPLSIAAKKLSPELVKICIKYGADPMQEFPCLNKGNIKNAHLVAADAYNSKLRKHRENELTELEYFQLYKEVIAPMREITPLAQSGAAP